MLSIVGLGREPSDPDKADISSDIWPFFIHPRSSGFRIGDEKVPLVRIDLRVGRKPEQITSLCDAVHSAVVAASRVPNADRYQIVHEHEAGTLFVEDTGLGICRTEDVVIVSVVSRPRNKEAKLAFYRILCERLESTCGLASSDVMVNITTNSDADWSFGLGRAQFLTGEL